MSANAIVGDPGCKNEACGEAYSEWKPHMYEEHWRQNLGHNCTGYVAWRLIQNGAGSGIWPGTAYQWPKWFEDHGTTVDKNAAPGSIAYFDGGSGHVSYVEKVVNLKKSNGETYTEITTYEDNASGSFGIEKFRSDQAGYPTSFIHYRDIGNNKVMWDNSFRLLSTTASTTLKKYDSMGSNGDIPISGDWDGDGDDTLGFVRGGRWHLFNGEGKDLEVYPNETWIKFGTRTTIPVVGDWNGDGHDDIGYRYSNVWYLDFTDPKTSKSDGVADQTFTLGASGTAPIVGDWNGDGKDTFGTVTRTGSTRTWTLWNDRSNASPSNTFTFPNRTYVIGDWNGDGYDTIGYRSTSDGSDTWILNNYLPGEVPPAGPNTAAIEPPGDTDLGDVLEPGTETDPGADDTTPPIVDPVVPGTDGTTNPLDPVVEVAPVVAYLGYVSSAQSQSTVSTGNKIYDPPMQLKINLFKTPTFRDIPLAGDWTGVKVNGKKIDSIGLAR